jgi:hypothetical protein
VRDFTLVFVQVFAFEVRALYYWYTLLEQFARRRAPLFKRHAHQGGVDVADLADVGETGTVLKGAGKGSHNGFCSADHAGENQLIIQRDGIRARAPQSAKTYDRHSPGSHDL